MNRDYGDDEIDDENPSSGESKSEVEASEIGEEDKGGEEGAQWESLAAETADNATGRWWQHTRLHKNLTF